MTSSLDDARMLIAGKTFLVIQLMQGAKLVCHHSRRVHYAQVNGVTVTEIHQNEAGLVGELYDYHGVSFRQLHCLSSVGDIGDMAVEWSWLAAKSNKSKSGER